MSSYNPNVSMESMILRIPGDRKHAQNILINRLTMRECPQYLIIIIDIHFVCLRQD